MVLDEIESQLDRLADTPLAAPLSQAQVGLRAGELLQLAEAVLEQWVLSRGAQPGSALREGFRLLGLHHQGVKGEPSFNACRETCREVAYHYNVLTQQGQAQQSGPVPDASAKLLMMTMLVRHLNLFVSGKLRESGLGDFCCASRPIRSGDAQVASQQ